MVGSEEAEEDSKDGSSGVLHFCSTLLYKSRCQEILDQVHLGAIFRRNASGWSVAYFQLNMSSLSTYLQHVLEKVPDPTLKVSLEVFDYVMGWSHKTLRKKCQKTFSAIASPSALGLAIFANAILLKPQQLE